MSQRPRLEWSIVGENIRRARFLQNLTQGQLAKRAGLAVATVHHAEEGRPLVRRTLEKICGSLDCSVDHITSRQRTHLTDDADLLIHRVEDGVWNAIGDRRTKVPDDDLERIQAPEERARLGKLGLVPLFNCAFTFILPEGPGTIRFELYGTHEDAINAMIYHDCVLLCDDGEAEITVRGNATLLRKGDAAGFRSADLERMVAKPESFARLTWIGANRVGRLPKEDEHERIRTRREP